MGMILDIGLVIAVGPGGYSTETGQYIPMTVKAGEQVVYLKFTANDIDIDGESHKLVAQRDILGVVGKE